MGAAALFGLIAGMVLALSFRLFANRAAIRDLRRRLWGCVLELRLFGEEPALAFATLLRTLRINGLLLARVLPPLAAAAPLLALAAFQGNEFFARTPLQTGADAVLTVRLRGAGDPLPPVGLQTPPWIEVDAPPVHIPAAREISWRLRATAPKVGLCQISVAGQTVTKQLDARTAPQYSATARDARWMEALLEPAESRLPDGPIERIWISRIPAPLSWAGLTLEWWEWSAAIAGIAAWLFSIPLPRPSPAQT